MYTYRASSAFRILLVIPIKGPIYPSKRDRKKLAPTSQNNPIAVSGIANCVFSVAILKGAKADSKPAPAPTMVKIKQ